MTSEIEIIELDARLDLSLDPIVFVEPTGGDSCCFAKCIPAGTSCSGGGCKC